MFVLPWISVFLVDSFSSRFVDARVFMPEHQEISRSIMISPETYELPYEIVSIRTNDNFLLMAYLIVHIEQNYNIIPTIILYHGNGGNIGDWWAKIKIQSHCEETLSPNANANLRNPFRAFLKSNYFQSANSRKIFLWDRMQCPACWISRIRIFPGIRHTRLWKLSTWLIFCVTFVKII